MDSSALANTINFISISVTVISISITILFYRKSKKLQKELKSFNWEKVHASSLELAKKIRKDFVPDVIITYTPRSGIIAQLLRDSININAPLFVGIVFHKKSPRGFHPKNFIKIETNKMDIYLPDSILDYKDKKVLIVDEYILTGDSLDLLKKYFITIGFESKKLKTASLIETTTAKLSRKSPDFSFFTLDYSDFYLPWGKAL